MPFTNYHSHCDYCDGGAPIEDFVAEAADRGLLAYGVSSHAPLPFDCKWAMRSTAIKDYMRRIDYLRCTRTDLPELYTGLEVDFIPGIAGPRSSFIRALDLDYTIGSIHFIDAEPDGRPWEVDGSNRIFQRGLDAIFDGDIEAAVRRYFALTREMVETSCPDVVGHLDKIKIQNASHAYFDEGEPWYRREMLRTLDAIADTNVVVEVNTRGFYKGKATLYPSIWVLEEMAKRDIPVTINSDAHLPSEIIKGFTEAAGALFGVGYRELTVLTDGHWRAMPFDDSGLIRHERIAV